MDNTYSYLLTNKSFIIKYKYYIVIYDNTYGYIEHINENDISEFDTINNNHNPILNNIKTELLKWNEKISSITIDFSKVKKNILKNDQLIELRKKSNFTILNPVYKISIDIEIALTAQFLNYEQFNKMYNIRYSYLYDMLCDLLRKFNFKLELTDFEYNNILYHPILEIIL